MPARLRAGLLILFFLGAPLALPLGGVFSLAFGDERGWFVPFAEPNTHPTVTTAK